MTEEQEKLYMEAQSHALKEIISHCQNKLRSFGVELKTKDEFDQERIETIALLRMHCDEYGDNDWDDDLHLSDVIDKHLVRHIEDRQNRGVEETYKK